MSVPPINLRRLQQLAHALELNDVAYRLGAKAPLRWDAGRIKAIDCSGYARWLVYHATDPALVIPDGSWNQRAWCEAQGMENLPYARVAPRANDSTLYICFIPPAPPRPGHVFFVNDGETFESRGGAGPSSRPWTARVLRAETEVAYIWPHVWI